MEVWVRSQDKERFLLIKGVRFCKYKKGYFEKNKTLKEIAESEDAYGVDCNGEIFGEYATKERCLEIIDEIQRLLVNNGSTEDRISAKVSGIQNNFIVYEMPKE